MQSVGEEPVRGGSMGIDKNGILKGGGGPHKVVKGETEG